MNFIKDLINSNRWKHLIGGFILGLFLTIFCSIGAAGGMEFKDTQYGDEWDWKDFWFTILGGFIGQIIQIIFLYYIIY